MADKKITELTNITGANLVDADEFVVVDISADETKAITLGELKEAFDSGSGFVRITGDTMTGDLALSGADVNFGDNDKATFGAGSDLQIYHDGATGHSIITESGGGALQLRGENLILEHPTTGNNYLLGVDGASGYVKLYHNGSDKLTTTATGVDITGTLTSDGLKLDAANSEAVIGNNASYQGKIKYNDSLGEFEFRNTYDTTFRGYAFYRGSTDKTSLRLDGNGDISFYEDTGTTPKFFWDASAERLGIGNAAPTTALDVTGTVTATEFNIAEFSTSTNVLQSNTGETGARLRASVSSAGFPTFAFSDDDNTGIFHPAADTLGFSTNASERMRIDSSGNVGIGTSSPSALLHLESAGPSIKLVDNNNNPDYEIKNGNGSFRIIDTTAGSDRINIDSSGNVGIGTSSPSTFNQRVNAPHLVVGTGGNAAGLTLYSGTASQSSINFAVGTTTSQQYDGGFTYVPNSGSPYLTFHVNAGSERMRIDSSGNLLVGTTSNSVYNDVSGTGIALNAGEIQIAGTGTTIYANRQGSDGDIAQFRKDGSTVGSIGTVNGFMGLGTGDTGLVFVSSDDSIRPFNTSTNSDRDNAIDLGQTSVRFDDIYATNGTIQTSDRNEKQDIEALSDAEQRVAVACKGLLRKFRWKDAVAEKGDAARIHFGIIAQDLQDAFAAEGLDAGRYAMFISSTWTDEETGEERTRMGVRYPELLAFIIAAI